MINMESFCALIILIGLTGEMKMARTTIGTMPMGINPGLTWMLPDVVKSMPPSENSLLGNSMINIGEKRLCLRLRN